MSTIAIIHYAGPPGLGGVEVTIQHHAQRMAAAGHHVKIVAGSAALAHHAVEVITDPRFGSRGGIVERVNRQLAAGIVDADYHALRDTLYSLLQPILRDVDVVIIHNALTLHKNLALTAALHALHADHALGRLLAWCHDFAWQDPLYLPELHPGEPWDLLRQPWANARYIVVSNDRRSLLAELLGVAEDTISVVHPGIDPSALLKLEPDTQQLVERYDLFKRNPLLLLPARITRRKNIEYAIAITGALRDRGLHPMLIVTGPPGPHNPTNAAYLAQLRALQHSSNTEDSVLFLYHSYTDIQGQPRSVSDTMMADLYRLADGVLFTSRAEGFGIPVIEAGLTGVPIFCSNIAPFHETAGPAAVYFELDADPQATAEQIAQALASDPRHALRARVREHYTWEAVYRNHIAPLLA